MKEKKFIDCLWNKSVSVGGEVCHRLILNLLFTAVCQYIVKFVLALIDTPFFYLFTRKNKTEENLLQ